MRKNLLQWKVDTFGDTGRKKSKKWIGYDLDLILIEIGFLISRNELARPVMGTIFLVYIYVCRNVGLSMGNPYKKRRMPKCMGGITWPKEAHAQSQFWAVKTDLRHPHYSFYYTLEQL